MKAFGSFNLRFYDEIAPKIACVNGPPIFDSDSVKLDKSVTLQLAQFSKIFKVVIFKCS